ncbi:MAG: 2-amino-4-hydroxy-6-hydroxymethyldihydropteridine diphosphokinase [Alcanivoracaceae bacterium]
MTLAFIGLGSNLGDSVAHLLAARAALAALPETRLTAASPLYRSAPVGPQDQPDYVNAVIAIDTALTPTELLHALLDIEQQRGRVRGRHWGERTLDMDLLLYGSEVVDLADLQIPHPRLHLRAFVLRPLLDIDATLHLPDGTPLAPCCVAIKDQPLCPHIDERWSRIP